MMVGSAGAWWLGRSVGRAGLLRFMGPGELARAEGVTARFGGAALVLSRPVPVLAEATSLLAGACGMPFRRAMLLSALSNAGISAAYAAVGAYSQHADSFLLAFAGAIGLPGIAMLVARIGWRRSLAEGSPPT
jgi:membrane protein DedA with SNARE-associated domain